jgi:hypothetical protein
MDEGSIQASGMMVVDIFDRDVLTEPCLCESGLEPAVFALGHLPVDQKAQSLFELNDSRCYTYQNVIDPDGGGC